MLGGAVARVGHGKQHQREACGSAPRGAVCGGNSGLALVVQRSVMRLRFAVWIIAVLSSSGLLVHAAAGNGCALLIEWKGVRYDAANFGRSAFRAGG